MKFLKALGVVFAVLVIALTVFIAIALLLVENPTDERDLDAKINSIISESIPTSHVVLTIDNTVNFRLPFTRESVADAIASLNKLDSTLPSNYPIYLTLSTPGGSVMAGLELYAFIKGMNRPVHTVTFFAASMGFQTVQQLGERHIVDFGRLMSHQAYGGFEGEFSHGKSQIDARYDLWLTIVKEMDMKTVERTNGKQTLESYQAAYENEMWLTGKTAVKLGYADYLAKVSCHYSLLKEIETIVIANIFGKMTFTIPACPLDKRVLSQEIEVETKHGLIKMQDLLKLNPALKTCEQLTTEARVSGDAKLLNVPCAVNAQATMEKINQNITETVELLKGNVEEHSVLKGRKQR